jgi:acyl carrier protein
MDRSEGRPSRAAVAQQLAAIWKQVLGKEVSPGDDFFAVGGDSLGAIRLVMEVQTAFHVDLDVETFFEAPSIDRLTNLLTESASR